MSFKEKIFKKTPEFLNVQHNIKAQIAKLKNKIKEVKKSANDVIELKDTIDGYINDIDEFSNNSVLEQNIEHIKTLYGNLDGQNQSFGCSNHSRRTKRTNQMQRRNNICSTCGGLKKN